MSPTQIAFLGGMTVGVLWTLVALHIFRGPLAEFAALVQIARIRAQQRQFARQNQKRLESLRATVLAVGGISIDGAGNLFLLAGWSFDGRHEVPEQYIDSKGQLRVFGYTRAELIELHARRDEYVDRAGC